MINELFKNAAEIIEKAAQSTLGIAALIIIIISGIAISFFRKASEKMRMVSFSFITIGFLGFGLAILWSYTPSPTNQSLRPYHQSLRQALERYKYKLGWSSQPVGVPDNNPSAATLGRPTFNSDNSAKIPYTRDDGRGVGEICVTIGNRELTGTWKDVEGEGELKVIFDDESFARAEGWWNRYGRTQQHNATMRRTLE